MFVAGYPFEAKHFTVKYNMNQFELLVYRGFWEKVNSVTADSGDVDVTRCAPSCMQGFPRFPTGRFRYKSAGCSGYVFFATGARDAGR